MQWASLLTIFFMLTWCWWKRGCCLWTEIAPKMIKWMIFHEEKLLHLKIYCNWTKCDMNWVVDNKRSIKWYRKQPKYYYSHWVRDDSSSSYKCFICCRLFSSVKFNHQIYLFLVEMSILKKKFTSWFKFLLMKLSFWVERSQVMDWI